MFSLKWLSIYRRTAAHSLLARFLGGAGVREKSVRRMRRIISTSSRSWHTTSYPADLVSISWSIPRR